MSQKPETRSIYVRSWFVMKYKNGMFQLVFNTTKRNIPFGWADHNTFFFGEPAEEGCSREDFDLNFKERLQVVPSFLPEGKEFTYTIYQSQDKDQTYFLYVPDKYFDQKPEQIASGD